jgi:hypothetical protein
MYLQSVLDESDAHGTAAAVSRRRLRTVTRISRELSEE